MTKPLLAISERQVCPFFLSTSWGILRESLNFSTRFSFLKPHLTKSESKFSPKVESNLPSFVKATRDHEKSFISLVFFFAPRLQEYWFFVFKRNSQLKRFLPQIWRKNFSSTSTSEEVSWKWKRLKFSEMELSKLHQWSTERDVIYELRTRKCVEHLSRADFIYAVDVRTIY